MSEELEALERIEGLLRILVKSQMKGEIDLIVNDKKMKKLYKLTGSGSSIKLAGETGLSKDQIKRAWLKWEQIGLVTQKGKLYEKVL